MTDIKRDINALIIPRRQIDPLPDAPAKSAIPARTGVATPQSAAASAATGGGLVFPLTVIARKSITETLSSDDGSCEIDVETDLELTVVDGNGVTGQIFLRSE